jgi:DNA-binding transcriptional regulator WhiA
MDLKTYQMHKIPEQTNNYAKIRIKRPYSSLNQKNLDYTFKGKIAKKSPER